jgi:ferredoxin
MTAFAPLRRNTRKLEDGFDNLTDFRCHTIMKCVDVCPKGPNAIRAITKIKDMLSAMYGLTGRNPTPAATREPSYRVNMRHACAKGQRFACPECVGTDGVAHSREHKFAQSRPAQFVT